MKFQTLLTVLGTAMVVTAKPFQKRELGGVSFDIYPKPLSVPLSLHLSLCLVSIS